ncbi:hypothetical protein BJ912DRAFT_947783, partial [Pholiota molesta]
METTKKRKRDIDLPRIVYDATTRVFDRLFKEDSLEGMKDVVRKKLGVPSSTPVQLAQLRDGQTVDLEDDDDFEAFSSSAYKSSTAKVKVIVGSGTSTIEANGVPAFAQTPEASDRKKKKSKDKKKQDALDLSQDQHRAVTPQTTPSESPPPSKKRRVSFVEPSLQLNKEINKVAAQWDRLASLNGLESTPEQESTHPEENVESISTKQKRQERRKERRKERPQKAAEVESSKESTPIVQDGTPQPDSEKEKKKKRKKEKKSLESAKQDESTVTPEPQPGETVDKPAKAKSQKVNGINDAATDDTAATKKSKKRSRATETDSTDKLESGKATTPNSSTEPPPETENTEEASRSAKKQKHAHKDGVNAGADGSNKKSSTKETNTPNAPEVPPPKTPKKSKIKSPAIITSEDSDPETAAPSKKSSGEVDAPIPTKKARRKSDAHPSAPITPAEKQPTKKSNDSSSQSKDIPPVVPEAAAPTEKTPANPKPEKNSDATPTAAEAKTPKKATKKADTSEPTEDTKAATKAAVAAILARKQAATAATQPEPVIALSAVSAKKTAAIPGSSLAQTTAALAIADPALLQISSDESISAAVPSSAKGPEAPQSSTSKVTKTPVSSAHILAHAKTAVNGSTTLSASAKKPAKAANPSTCPVCGAVPWHIRSKCPIIKSGIRAMRRRIGELELELVSDDEDNDNEGISAIIAELRVQIEKKTKKPKPTPAAVQEEESPPAAAAPAVKSVDASPPSIEVNVVSSSAAQPLLPDAEAEPLSARAAPSAGPLPSKPAPSTQSRKSIIPVPSSTQPNPSIRSLYTIQPLSATQPSHSNQPSASQPSPLSHKEPKKPRPSMPPPKPPAIDLPIFPSFGDLALAATTNILGFAGDVSTVSDHDL